MKAGVKFSSNLNAVVSALEKAAYTHMVRACIHLTNAAKRKLTGPRTGRMYVIPGLVTIKQRQQTSGRKLTTKQRARRRYRASAPYEAPAVLFGHLRNSIKYTVVGKGMHIQGIVGSDLDKAPWLEFGTTRMFPRPFLKPAYEEEKQTLKSMLGGVWLP